MNGLSESLAVGAYAGLYASRACALEVGLCDAFEASIPQGTGYERTLLMIDLLRTP